MIISFSTFKWPKFGEAVKDVILLSREFIDTKFKSTGSKGLNGPTQDGLKVVQQNRLAFDYYFKNGSIEKYILKKRDLFAMLPGYEDEINHFMKKNKLKHEKRGDLVRIASHYNDLQN